MKVLQYGIFIFNFEKYSQKTKNVRLLAGFSFPYEWHEIFCLKLIYFI